MATPTFQVNFVLTRVPKVRFITGLVEQELLDAMENILWPAVKENLDRNVVDWGQKPAFEHSINLSRGRADFVVKVRMDKAGEIYEWVDKGTGLEGKNKSKYPIDPKSPNVTFLKFVTPYQPKTYPPTQLRYSPTGQKVLNYRKHVDHPGIQARKFTELAFAHFKDRGNIRGFYRVIEAAYRRAFRKLEGN